MSLPDGDFYHLGYLAAYMVSNEEAQQRGRDFNPRNAKIPALSAEADCSALLIFHVPCMSPLSRRRPVDYFFSALIGSRRNGTGFLSVFDRPSDVASVTVTSRALALSITAA